ncbi:MmgE/PrpD family protein, partial [Thermodesulfobacteriota bacterium]
MLGFDNEKINYAMGIGYNQCSGTYGATVGEDGGLMAQLSQGLGAKTGVLSVLLADIGFTAFKDVIDGKWGLYTMYGNGEYDPEILTGDLGRRFEMLNPGIKRYPGCGATQPVVYGTLELARENNIRGEDVAKVRIGAGESSYRLCGENKGEPPNSADALWNYRYSAAVALIKKKVFVDDFTDTAIREPQVLELLRRIDVYPDKSLTRDIFIEIDTKDDKSYRKTVSDMVPMSEAEIVEKFKNCNRFSARPLSEESVENFIQVVNELEKLENIDKIVGILSGLTTL